MVSLESEIERVVHQELKAGITDRDRLYWVGEEQVKYLCGGTLSTDEIHFRVDLASNSYCCELAKLRNGELDKEVRGELCLDIFDLLFRIGSGHGCLEYRE